MRSSPLFAAALALALSLLLAGCCDLTGGQALLNQTNISTPEEPPNYDYDLFVKGIIPSPQKPQLSEEYKAVVMVQSYGFYTPSGYHIWVLDNGNILMDEDVQNPDLQENFEFKIYANDTAPHHLTAQVKSIDPIHMENESKLGNNILSGNVQAYPIGFYDLENPKYTWYYDAVGMQIKEAQSFTLRNPMNISKVGVYVQARVVQAQGSELIVSLYNAQPNENISGLGEKIISSKIDATAIGPDPSWIYVEFPRMELAKGKYWIVLEYYSPSGGGIEWYRSEGNHYGEFLDTQMMDVAGWGEWEFKGFDFAFKVE